jgi:hypothetical protein
MGCVRFLFHNQIRKIRVDDGICLNELKKRCCALFDLDAHSPICLSYRNNEDKELINVDSEPTLKELVKGSPYLLVLHVENHVGIGQHAFAPDPVPHWCEQKIQHTGEWRIVCNICEQNIEGTHYRCISCPEFELCTRCLRFSSLAHSPNHYFAQLMDSSPLSPNPMYAVIETVSPAKERAEEILQDTKQSLNHFWGSTRGKANQIRNSQQFQNLVSDTQTGLQNVSSWMKQLFVPAQQPEGTSQNPIQMQPLPAEQEEQNSSSSSSLHQEESNQ